jgi:hypothetical protein
MPIIALPAGTGVTTEGKLGLEVNVVGGIILGGMIGGGCMGGASTVRWVRREMAGSLGFLALRLSMMV